jgi:hypothetical protein
MENSFQAKNNKMLPEQVCRLNKTVLKLLQKNKNIFFYYFYVAKITNQQ